MKNKIRVNPFPRLFAFVLVLVIIAVAAAIGLFYYIFGISEPEGLSLASWPQKFTDNFSVWMENENGTLTVEDIAIERLDEYGLWFQAVDENGKEVFTHNKPSDYPMSYSASQMAAFSTSTYENGSTVFVGRFEEDGASWSYLVGFPYAIGKHMLYYNRENVGRLGPVFRMGIGFALIFIVLLVLAYGFYLTRHLGKITKGIDSISRRSYQPLPEKGMFREVYRELNKMDTQIRGSDKLQKDTERTRREWIANITHDLKTPLSPVKGYAALLSGDLALDCGTVQAYGQIILKNANHAEQLINDLKLAYQLESGAMPFRPEKIQLIRCLREIVIDIVNDPAFCDRMVEFESNIEEVRVYIDIMLFGRAIENLIVNALTHNPPETKVTVRVNVDKKDMITVTVRDNGKGVDEEEQSQLFERYYRGTNTKEKPEGSGLGLAIAKQIVKLCGGEISVKSKLNEGTEFVILLPMEEK